MCFRHWIGDEYNIFMLFWVIFVQGGSVFLNKHYSEFALTLNDRVVVPDLDNMGSIKGKLWINQPFKCATEKSSSQ